MRAAIVTRVGLAPFLALLLCTTAMPAVAADEEAQIIVPLANIRESPSRQAAVVFQARRGETETV